MEQPTLTREQVERAERREGIYHPVIALLESYAPQIEELNQRYRKITDNQEQQKFLRENLGFLADALEGTEDFTLTPLELIAIWSKAHEFFSGYGRYALARMLSCAYAIKNGQNQAYRGFVRHRLEDRELPQEVKQDREGLLYIQRRLAEISASLDEVDFYTYGTRESAMELGFNLAKRVQEGDKVAQKELDTLIQREKEYKTEVLAELHENFGNGMIPVVMDISMALEEQSQ